MPIYGSARRISLLSSSKPHIKKVRAANLALAQEGLIPPETMRQCSHLSLSKVPGLPCRSVQIAGNESFSVFLRRATRNNVNF